MIRKSFWQEIADNWSKEDDGIIIPEDSADEGRKAQEIREEDIGMFNNISNDEIDDILSDLGLDDI